MASDIESERGGEPKQTRRRKGKAKRNALNSDLGETERAFWTKTLGRKFKPTGFFKKSYRL